MRVRNQLALVASLALVLSGGAMLARNAHIVRGSDSKRGVDSGAKVHVAGVMVNAPTGGGSESFPNLAFFGTFEKTRVALQLRLEHGGIVDLVQDASSIDVFSDDQGTDLRKVNDHFGPFEMMPSISEDKRSMVFVAPSDKLPAPRCKRITVRGKVGVLVADETTTARSAVLTVADGSSFTSGSHTFEIADTGPSDWGEGWSLTLVTTQDPSAIVRYAFVDTAGKEHELLPSMSMSGGSSWHQTLETEQPLERGSFLIESWKAPKTLEIPFDVQLGIGLR